MGTNSLTKWLTIPTEALICQIESRFHKPLLEKLPFVLELFDSVIRQHGSTHFQLNELHHMFSHFSQRIPLHLLQEEQILFPILKEAEKNPSLRANIPFSNMENEHTTDLIMIKQFRTLTDDFKTPPGASQNWKTLYSELKVLCLNLEIHIKLENEVLFKRFTREASSATKR